MGPICEPSCETNDKGARPRPTNPLPVVLYEPVFSCPHPNIVLIVGTNMLPLEPPKLITSLAMSPIVALWSPYL